NGTQLARRRGLGRTALLAGTAMLVLLGSAQAASAAPKLTSVSPTAGCPGTEVKLLGTGFTGSSAEVEWVDNGAQKFPTLFNEAKVTSSTTATAIVPFMLQTQASGSGALGTVGLYFGKTNAGSQPFTYTNVQNCFTGGGGGGTGPTGPEGARGEKGEKGEK